MVKHSLNEGERNTFTFPTSLPPNKAKKTNTLLMLTTQHNKSISIISAPHVANLLMYLVSVLYKIVSKLLFNQCLYSSNIN